ncbi:MAG: hypothetical protein ACKPKO_49350, partial [Candidatus Fonsibacter sp.]
YFVRPDGWVTHLKVRGYIPYLIPGSPDCQPQKPRGKLQFCCSSLHIDGTRRALLGDEPAPEVDEGNVVTGYKLPPSGGCIPIRPGVLPHFFHLSATARITIRVFRFV